jgi:hypothetical protein
MLDDGQAAEPVDLDLIDEVRMIERLGPRRRASGAEGHALMIP